MVMPSMPETVVPQKDIMGSIFGALPPETFVGNYLMRCSEADVAGDVGRDPLHERRGRGREDGEPASARADRCLSSMAFKGFLLLSSAQDRTAASNPSISPVHRFLTALISASLLGSFSHSTGFEGP